MIFNRILLIVLLHLLAVGVSWGKTGWFASIDLLGTYAGEKKLSFEIGEHKFSETLTNRKITYFPYFLGGWEGRKWVTEIGYGYNKAMLDTNISDNTSGITGAEATLKTHDFLISIAYKYDPFVMLPALHTFFGITGSFIVREEEVLIQRFDHYLKTTSLTKKFNIGASTGISYDFSNYIQLALIYKLDLSPSTSASTIYQQDYIKTSTKNSITHIFGTKFKYFF